MWIASKYGFFSIVKKEDVFHVRARCQADLDNLRSASGISDDVKESYPGSDYPWRLIVGTESLGKVFQALEATIDYGNFKGMIGTTSDQRDKLDAYHHIWAEMNRWQESKGR
jgi:hypothetical protein